MADPSHHCLVIDQGGHASRAVIFDRNGRIVSNKSVNIETQRDDTDRVEHDPEELIASVLEAVRLAVNSSGIDPGTLSRAGLAAQRSSIVCWDNRTGTPLSPVISWQDTRTAPDIGRYSAYEKDIHVLTGLVLSPHYGASKLRWCLENLPQVSAAYAQSRLACGPLSSFILFHILDERPLLVDPANASRTLLWNYRSHDWANELLELFVIPRTVLPACVPNEYEYGHLSAGDYRIPLVMVTGDQSAALYALGEPQADTTYINLGTGAFLQRPLDDGPVEAGSLLCSVVRQSAEHIEFVLEGTVNGAGSALQLFSTETGTPVQDLYRDIAHGMASVKAPPLFLNGVSGLGSPFWVADYASRYIGEGSQTEKLVAVIESIVFLVMVNLAEMAAYAGQSTRLVVTGGLSVVDGLCQRLADLSGVVVERPQLEEATARGAAWLLSGVTCSTLPVSKFYAEPEPALQKRYGKWLHEMKKSLSPPA